MSGSLTVHPKALIDALAAVKPAVARTSAVQALSGVRVCGAESLAELHATDMEVAVRRLLPCESVGELDTVVSHADLSKAVGRFAKRESVSLRVERHPNDARKLSIASIDLTVTDGRRTIELRGLRYNDWPRLDFGAGEPWFDAPGPELAALIARAATFAADDDKRPVLAGLFLDPAEQTLAATDSYRLGIFRLPIGELHTDGKANVPARCLKLAAKAIKASSAVALRLEAAARGRGAFVHVRTADCDWRMRIIDGQYPSYRQLWPDFAAPGYADVELSLPVDELREACETAVAFGKYNAPMCLNVNGGVKVHGRTPDRCSYSEELAGATIVRHPGEEFEIGFNPAFVRDIAKVANNGELTLAMQRPMRPGAWLDGEDRYLLMPIRLNV